MDLVEAEALLDIEPHALGQRQLGSIAYRVGGPAHVGLPAVGACLPPSSGLFFAAECAADPVADRKRSASRRSSVKTDEESPAPTALCDRIASSSPEYRMT